jgi:uncharacterized protein (TIGR03085 family)
MSPLSVLRVTSNVAAGSISKAGADGMVAYATAVPEPLDARERRELCDLLEELGPDAPTLCDGWTTIDLTAHLVLRERDPRAAPGILLGGRFEASLQRLTERVLDRGYERLVDQVRTGPPPGPMALPGLRTVLNLNEYAVHHEDVRRANGLGPRNDRADLQNALWGLQRHGARLALRKVHGVRVVLARPDGKEIAVGRGPEVTMVGEPLELQLYLLGRGDAAQVEVSGDPDAQGTLAGSDLGI